MDIPMPKLALLNWINNKLFKFLKKNISYRSWMFRRFFMFKNVCLFLFCGYMARYAPLKYK